MQKFIIIFLFFLILTHKLEAKIRYQGGMLIHSGYLSVEHPENKQNGLCYGFGGQLVFLISEHIRAGAEGYTSYFHYPQDNGIFRLGWGGILFGYQFSNKKIRPGLNFTFGGGGVNDMQFIEVDASDYEADRIIYRRFAVMIFAPAISAEYTLKSKFTAVVKIDYLVPLAGSKTSNLTAGPRLYIGLLFSR